jgi:hypothetical protein
MLLDFHTAIPFTVDDAGFTPRTRRASARTAKAAPARVIDDKGKKGDANQAVITALIDADKLFARGRLKHTYPHSWRSKKPVIFRNTPQWFVHMDKDLGDGTTLRSRALNAIDDTRFVPPAGQNRLRDDRGPARLGAVAPARLGCADLRLRRRERQRPEGRGRQQAHSRSLRGRRRGCLVRRRRQGALPRQRRHDPKWTRSPTFSMSGSIRARRTPSRSKTATT